MIKRNWRTRGYCGSLQPLKASATSGSAQHTHSVLFCPVERRFPYIRIQTRQVRGFEVLKPVICRTCDLLLT